MSKRRDLEGPIHRSVLSLLESILPGAVVHHSPNEFPGKGEMVKRAIAKAKWNGMKPGYPDLIAHYKGDTMAFEVKAEGGTTSDPQKEIHEALRSQGVHVAVVRSQEDTIEALDEWGIEHRGQI